MNQQCKFALQICLGMMGVLGPFFLAFAFAWSYQAQRLAVMESQMADVRGEVRNINAKIEDYLAGQLLSRNR